MSTTRISDSDLASVALYDKVNAIANEFDAEVVKVFGDQTIRDVKTFMDEIYAPNQLDYSRITNCLTHVPQDIKLELNNGTLTAKKGSKVWIPHGTTEAYQVGDIDAYGHTVVATSWDEAKFFYAIELRSDFNYPSLAHANADRVVFVSILNNNLTGWDNDWVFSDSTAPSPSGTTYVWYDTTNNVVKSTNNSGSTWTTGLSLPICIGNYINGSGFTSIDQTFNGFGYIGSTVFALPGVKGLIPNGRNADESLKNIETTVNKVAVLTFGSNVNTPYNGRFLLNSSGGIFARVGGYDPVRNYITASDNKTPLIGCSFAEGCLVEAGVIKIFNSKLPFHAVDYNDVVLKYGNVVLNNQVEFRNSGNVWSTAVGNQRDSRYNCKFYEYGLADNVLPSETVYGGVHCWDKNHFEYSTIYSSISPDGSVGSHFWVRTPNGTAATMGIIQGSDGATRTYAPTPPASDNSVQIATTAWVNTRLGGTNVTSTELGYLDGVTSNIQTQLNGKQGKGSYADTSATNFTTTGKSTIAGWGMPSNRYIDLTLGASGSTYTATANGYFYINGTSTSVTAALGCSVNNIYGDYKPAAYNSSPVRILIPVTKGDVFSLSYTNVTVSQFRFIYAEGAQ